MFLAIRCSEDTNRSHLNRLNDNKSFNGLINYFKNKKHDNCTRSCPFDSNHYRSFNPCKKRKSKIIESQIQLLKSLQDAWWLFLCLDFCDWPLINEYPAQRSNNLIE
jgi:hypothetical protein